MKTLMTLTTLWLLTGCAAMVTTPAVGMFYSEVSAPLYVTSNTGTSKKGEATCTSIMGFAAFGDCSVETIKKSAGIKKVTTVDTKVSNMVGVVAKLTVIVYGE